MDIFSMVGVAVISAVLCVLLREAKPEYAMLISLACGILIFLAALIALAPVFETLKAIMSKAGINSEYIKAIIKTLGICYVTQLAYDVCTDAGQTAIAGKIELAGKVFVVLISLPMFEDLIDTAFSLINMA